MNQNVEEIRERCKPKTEMKARMEVCVTRIDKVDTVMREKSEEHWKQEEELGEWKATRTQDPRQPSEQERIEHAITHLPFRSWCTQCIKGREREEDCRKAIEEERHVPGIHLDYVFVGDEKGRENVGVFAGQRKSDESCAQHGGSEEVDARLDMSKADGMAS